MILIDDIIQKCNDKLRSLHNDNMLCKVKSSKDVFSVLGDFFDDSILKKSSNSFIMDLTNITPVGWDEDLIYNEFNPDLIYELDFERTIYALQECDGHYDTYVYSNDLLSLMFGHIHNHIWNSLYFYKIHSTSPDTEIEEICTNAIVLKMLIQSYQENTLNIEQFLKTFNNVCLQIDTGLKFLGEMKVFMVKELISTLSNKNIGRTDYEDFSVKYYSIVKFYPWEFNFKNKDERDFLIKYIPKTYY